MLLTISQYSQIREERRALAKRLLIEAISPIVPKGYILSDDLRHMRQCDLALAVLTQENPNIGTKRIAFTYSVGSQQERDGNVRLTEDVFRAVGDVFDGTGWGIDDSFGMNDGCFAYLAHLDAFVGSGRNIEEIAAAARSVAAHACAFPPFVHFQWQKNRLDDFGKWELLNGERSLQTIWRSGNSYGTLMGTCPKSLGEAKSQAEAAARRMIISENQQRLAGLGRHLAAELGPDEPSSAPSM